MCFDGCAEIGLEGAEGSAFRKMEALENCVVRLGRGRRGWKRGVDHYIRSSRLSLVAAVQATVPHTKGPWHVELGQRAIALWMGEVSLSLPALHGPCGATEIILEFRETRADRQGLWWKSGERAVDGFVDAACVVLLGGFVEWRSRWVRLSVLG